MEFKKYLRGVGDAGTRLLFKFRSGMHGLNEELGRHRGREGRKECLLCDAECESVSHVLWDCPAYVSIRSAFMLELRREIGDRFERSSYVLGSEAWEEYSSGLLGLIKDFVTFVFSHEKLLIRDFRIFVINYSSFFFLFFRKRPSASQATLHTPPADPGGCGQGVKPLIFIPN